MTTACSVPHDDLALIDQPPTPVRISVEKDADAVRIEGVLVALNYTVTREGDDGLGEPGAASLQRLVARLSRRHHLSSREQSVLAMVLVGDDTTTIAAELGVSLATARWYELCLQAKTRTNTREELLRLALFGRVVRTRPKGSS